MLYSFGSWGKQGKLKTTIGIRRDQFDVVTRNAFVGDPVTHKLVRYDENGTTNGSIDSPSLGAVFHLTDWLSAYTNYSKSYVFSDRRQLSFIGTEIPAPIGTAREYGIRFRMGNKVTGSIGYYDSLQVNNPINVNNLTASVGRIYTALALGSFGQRGDTQTTTSTGYEVQITGNPTRSWTFSAALGLPKTTGTKSYGFALDEFLATEGPRFLQLAASDPAALAIVQTELTTENNIVANGRASDGQSNIRVPKMNGSILTRYTFNDRWLKGLALGGGVRYVGTNTINYSATGNNITVDDYYESTLFAQYQFIKWKNLTWKVVLNVNNPFNDLNFRYTTVNANTLDGLTYRITAPRNARLGIDLSF